MLMETQRRLLALLLLLLATFNSAPAENVETFFALGRELVLTLPAATGSISSVLWKHNNNLLAEWMSPEPSVVYYGRFRERTNLDVTTGRLEISNMAVEDAGLFTVEVNNKVQDRRYSAKNIQEVSEPTVIIRPLTCPSAMDICSLSCEVKGETKLVTYSWRKGDEEWGAWKDNMDIMNITREDTANFKTFSCSVKNPVSKKESQPIDNPFFQEKTQDGSGVELAVGISLTVLGLIGVVVAVVAYLNRDWIARKCSRREVAPKADEQPTVTVPLNDEVKKDEPTPE